MRCLAKRPADRWQTAEELVRRARAARHAERRDHADADAPVAAARGEAARFRWQARCGPLPRRSPRPALFLWKPWVAGTARAARCRSRRRPAVPDRRRRPERAVPAAGHGGPDAGEADRRRRAARRRCALGARRRARRRRQRHAGSHGGRGRRGGAEARRGPGAPGQHRGISGSSGDECVAGDACPAGRRWRRPA